MCACSQNLHFVCSTIKHYICFFTTNFLSTPLKERLYCKDKIMGIIKNSIIFSALRKNLCIDNLLIIETGYEKIERLQQKAVISLLHIDLVEFRRPLIMVHYVVTPRVSIAPSSTICLHYGLDEFTVHTHTHTHTQRKHESMFPNLGVFLQYGSFNFQFWMFYYIRYNQVFLSYSYLNTSFSLYSNIINFLFSPTKGKAIMSLVPFENSRYVWVTCSLHNHEKKFP